MSSVTAFSSYQKLGVALAGCGPDPDIFPSCHRAALRMRFSVAALASMMKFPAAVEERVLDSMS